ncbi:MAG: hypothetical protein VKQ33_05650 [Candidatus Sericytochromatia bacterium]|nr:hypothetical protein [Candidatus Sericytochromatia bacterium]
MGHTRSWPMGLALALLTACQAPPTLRAPTASKARPAAAQAGLVPEVRLPGSGTALVANNGGAIVSNNGAGQAQVPRATLFGRLLAPATLVSDQGGALVSNNGGTLVSDQGGALAGPAAPYRLADVGPVVQVPLADTRVEVLDATGAPVRDAAGRPITAVTDASGAFRFEAELPERSLIVSASLAANRGAIRAVATRDARGEALEADLFSTLTTSYIVGRFVAGQPDQQQTLDRLPGEVAEETRQLAAAAFTAAGALVPARLDEAAAVASAEALRQGNPTFDAQMEVVRRLLIAAGQSNMGEGRLATTVSLGYVGGFDEGPDGSVYVLADRLWRVRPDGVLVTAIGGGTVPPAEADGRPAGTVSLEGLDGWCLDPAGRPVVLVDNHLLRVETDGTVKWLDAFQPEVTWWARRNYALLAVREQDVWLTSREGGRNRGTGEVNPETLAIWRHVAGTEPTLIASLPRQSGIHHDLALVPGLGVLVHRHGTRLDAYTAAVQAAGTPLDLNAYRVDEFLAIDLDTGATTPWTPPVPLVDANLDRRGHLLYRAGTPERTWVLPAGGTGPISFGGWEGSVSGGTLAPDGQSLLVSTGNRVLRLTATGVTPVAGLDPNAQVGGNANDLALFEPMTMTIASDGEVWLTDRRRGTLMRIDAADQVHEVALSDPGFKDGQAYTFNFPNMRPGPDGTVFMLAKMKSGEALYRIRKDGTSSLVYQPPAGQTVGDFAPQGADMLMLLTSREQPHQLVRLAADGTTRTLFESEIVWTEYPRPNAEPYRHAKQEPDLKACDLLPAPSGDVWIFGQERLARWSTAKGFEVVRRGVHLMRPEEQNEGYTRGAAALGPDGRLYFTPGDMGNGSWNEVRRWDPGTDTEQHVAGPRGTIFQGGGVDDSLDDPHSPAFSPSGDLYFIDAGSKQVRRIPKDRLVGNPLARDSNPEE